MPDRKWAKLRDRNEALDCAVLARAALWLLGADRYGERFWQRLREEVADAPLASVPTTASDEAPTTPADTHPATAPMAGAMRPRTWLGARSGWLW